MRRTRLDTSEPYPVLLRSGSSVPIDRRKQRMREVVRARERVKRVRELDAPLVSLLCRMVTLLSYYENFLMILQLYDLTTASERPVGSGV